MDNIGIVVENLDEAISFFTEPGLKPECRAMVEGETVIIIMVRERSKLLCGGAENQKRADVPVFAAVLPHNR